jgi:hypothetical protein
VFDILSHQVPSDAGKDHERDFEATKVAAQNVSANQELTLEQVRFAIFKLLKNLQYFYLFQGFRKARDKRVC